LAGHGDDDFSPLPGAVLTEMLRTGKDTKGRSLHTTDMGVVRKYAPPWTGPGEPAKGVLPNYLRERVVIPVPPGEQHPFDPPDYSNRSIYDPAFISRKAPSQSIYAYLDDTSLFAPDESHSAHKVAAECTVQIENTPDTPRGTPDDDSALSPPQWGAYEPRDPYEPLSHCVLDGD
jgi:hypothetical protein